MTTTDMIERAAARRMPAFNVERAAKSGNVFDRIRAIALDKTIATDHSVEVQTKAAIDPTEPPLADRFGYAELLSAYRSTSMLPKLGQEIGFNRPTNVLVTPPPAAWVSRGKPIPVALGGFARVQLDALKLGSIVVLTNEQIRTSGEQADSELYRILRDAAQRAINTTLFSADAAVAGESPAGLAHGLTAGVPTGLDEESVFVDVLNLIDGMVEPILFAPVGYALRVAAALGNGAGTGSLLPVWAAAETTRVFAIDRTAVAYALGGIDVDGSINAALQMRDDPVNGPANLVSMFQTNNVALRVIGIANWEVLREDGVRVIELEGS